MNFYLLVGTIGSEKEVWAKNFATAHNGIIINKDTELAGFTGPEDEVLVDLEELLTKEGRRPIIDFLKKIKKGNVITVDFLTPFDVCSERINQSGLDESDRNLACNKFKKQASKKEKPEEEEDIDHLIEVGGSVVFSFDDKQPFDVPIAGEQLHFFEVKRNREEKAQIITSFLLAELTFEIFFNQHLINQKMIEEWLMIELTARLINAVNRNKPIFFKNQRFYDVNSLLRAMAKSSGTIIRSGTDNQEGLWIESATLQ